MIVAPARIAWRLAAVTDVIVETPCAKTLVLDVHGWSGHLAGQHVDVRLTAEGGYQAQRSYSIASAPEDAPLALTVERLEDGEVSPYLTDELRPGDELELRGPIGGYFIWRSNDYIYTSPPRTHTRGRPPAFGVPSCRSAAIRRSERAIVRRS
jgi:ferredoxin-NADP reductase